MRKLQSNENGLLLPLTSFILLQVPALSTLSPVYVATTCGLMENTLESITPGLPLGFFTLYRIFQGLGSHCLEKDKRAYRCSSCTSSFQHSVCWKSPPCNNKGCCCDSLALSLQIHLLPGKIRQALLHCCPRKPRCIIASFPRCL